MIATIASALLGVALIGTAVMVVTTRNLVHAVFWLASTMILTAAAFVALEAPFMGGIQIVLYAGGVITMMLFGVMLTHRDPDAHIPNPIAGRGRAAAVAGGLLALLLGAIWTSDLPTDVHPLVDSAQLGKLLLTDQLLAFELLSVLLLAAMIGAIVLARKVDP